MQPTQFELVINLKTEIENEIAGRGAGVSVTSLRVW